MRSAPHQSPDQIRPGSEADAAALSSVAVDFANTVACEACRTFDGLASPGAFARWNRAHTGLPVLPISDEVLSELRVLRRDLRETFKDHVEGSPPNPALIRRLNRWLGAYPTHLRAGFSRGRWRLEEVQEVTPPVQRWESLIAHAAAGLLAGPLSQRLRQCQAPGCAHYLVGRKRGQLWCSPTGCGNRVRVARHYRKRGRTRAPKQRSPGSLPDSALTRRRSRTRGAASRAKLRTARARRSSAPT